MIVSSYRHPRCATQEIKHVVLVNLLEDQQFGVVRIFQKKFGPRVYSCSFLPSNEQTDSNLVVARFAVPCCTRPCLGGTGFRAGVTITVRCSIAECGTVFTAHATVRLPKDMAPQSFRTEKPKSTRKNRKTSSEGTCGGRR